jgi:hypothetical protein
LLRQDYLRRIFRNADHCKAQSSLRQNVIHISWSWIVQVQSSCTPTWIRSRLLCLWILWT